jgi:hypothetical protein
MSQKIDPYTESPKDNNKNPIAIFKIGVIHWEILINRKLLSERNSHVYVALRAETMRIKPVYITILVSSI